MRETVTTMAQYAPLSVEPLSTALPFPARNMRPQSKSSGKRPDPASSRERARSDDIRPRTDVERRPLTSSVAKRIWRPEISEYSRSARSEEHTSELQSLMRISYAVFCLKKQKKQYTIPK